MTLYGLLYWRFNYRFNDSGPLSQFTTFFESDMPDLFWVIQAWIGLYHWIYVYNIISIVLVGTRFAPFLGFIDMYNSIRMIYLSFKGYGWLQILLDA